MASWRGCCFLGAVLLLVLQPSNAVEVSNKIHLDESNIIEHCGFRPGGAGPEKLLPGNNGHWNPNPSPWYVIFDFKHRFTVMSIELSNYGDVTHDVAQFTLETTDNITSSDNYKTVTQVTNVAEKISSSQVFTFSPATGRYWRFTVTKTHSIYQPWLQELTFSGHQAKEETCPSPYKLRGTECLFISEDVNDLLDWDESRQRCLSMGGDLAQPQDMVDFVEYIKENYPNSKSTIWLGATDREVEQEWYWVNGEPVPPAMWEPWPHNQPSGDGNCMEVHWRLKQGFYMNDWYCHNKGHFACEFNHISESGEDEDTSSESGSDEDISSENGDVEDTSSEGQGVEDTPCDWPTGQQYWPHPTNCRMFVQCAPYGPQEMHCAPGTAWSQSLLTCDFEANTNCGRHQPTSPPKSPSTSPPKSPSTAPPKSPPTSPPESPPDNVTCPSPYKIRGTECLFISADGNDLLDWDESRQRCLSMGGDLAQPQDMVDFVEYIKENYNNSKSTIWLGATDRDVEQDWYWLSGEPVPPAMWEPWPANQPSGDGNCMEIHWWPHTGFYMNDWYCNRKGHFACEFNMA